VVAKDQTKERWEFAAEKLIGDVRWLLGYREAIVEALGESRVGTRPSPGFGRFTPSWWRWRSNSRARRGHMTGQRSAVSRGW
jgi:hypothetical protein